jgi:hypothetical protein
MADGLQSLLPGLAYVTPETCLRRKGRGEVGAEWH